MTNRGRWENLYKSNCTPWDSGEVDPNLVRILKQYKIKPAKAIEIACGTGTNAIWLAEQGFNMTAVDISDEAIKLASSKIKTENVQINLLRQDFLKEGKSVGKAIFEFAFDRGGFHSFHSNKGRSNFADNLSYILKKDGMWLSLSGNADYSDPISGRPRLSATDIVTAVEKHFKILYMEAGILGQGGNLNSWITLMKKRG
jgi:SAM-dependent methyltransferase